MIFEFSRRAATMHRLGETRHPKILMKIIDWREAGKFWGPDLEGGHSEYVNCKIDFCDGKD